MWLRDGSPGGVQSADGSKRGNRARIPNNWEHFHFSVPHLAMRAKENVVTKLSSCNSVVLCLIVLVLCRFARAQSIQIANVEELYGAVNNPDNAGATLILAPGTYMLSAIDPNGVARPNKGRIQLQRDMSLMGVEGDRDAVVINAINLPTSSFPTSANGVATGPNAAVRIGLGHNTIEWLTVRDARNGQANIDTGLQPVDPADTYIRVAHVASTGSTRGMNILNFGPQSSGQTIEADIVDGYFFENVLNQAEGIRMRNFSGAVGSTVNVRISGNLSWGQKQGRLIVDNTASNSRVNVESSGNRFFDNGAGTVIAAGLTQGNGSADGNIITYTAYGDEFLENTQDTEFDHGGLVVLASDNASPSGGGGNNNTVDVQLYGCRMLGNSTWDLTAIGARTLPSADPSLNQNNHVTIEMNGMAREVEMENGNPCSPLQTAYPALPTMVIRS